MLRSIVSVLAVIIGAIAAPAAMAQSHLLILDGSAEAQLDSADFPDQSLDVPLTGQFLVTVLGSERVRITGNYHYEATLQMVCSLFPCPRNVLVPYPFEVHGKVSLVARISSRKGMTVYLAPRGKIAEDVTLHAYGITLSKTVVKTLPDLVLSPGRWGLGGEWFSNGPLVLDSAIKETNLFFEGPL